MSPRASEPSALRPRVGVPGPLRQWARIGRQAIRRAASRRAAWTLFVDADGVVAWPEVAGAPPRRYDSFEAWALEHRACRARIGVSGRLLHTLRLDEVATAANIVRLRLVAAQRFALYHGAAAAAWPIAVGRGSGFACALHGMTLASVVAVAAANEIDVAGMVPLWSRALARAVERAPVLASSGAARLLLVEHGLVTCLSLAAGELIDVQQRYLDSNAPAALDELLERLVTESGLAARDVVIAGWGMAGALPSAPPLVLGSLTGRPEDAGWLFATNDRAQA